MNTDDLVRKFEQIFKDLCETVLENKRETKDNTKYYYLFIPELKKVKKCDSFEDAIESHNGAVKIFFSNPAFRRYDSIEVQVVQGTEESMSFYAREMGTSYKVNGEVVDTQPSQGVDVLIENTLTQPE